MKSGVSKYSLLLVFATMTLFIVSFQSTAQSKKKGWTSLLDSDLSQWEVFMGIPHTSVDLPEEVEKSDNVHEGTPMGLNNDPKSVFTTIEEEGETILKITGEIYGGLTTLSSYSNYHLKMYFKWGDQKWEPRLNALRDNGILYHCQDPHGAFWNVWMASLEYQVQEGDIGDFISIAGVYADIPADRKENDNGRAGFKFNPKGKWYTFKWEDYESGRCSQSGLEEAKHGEWNELEIITFGDKSIHVVNGKVVNILKNARMDIDGKPQTIDSGKIQIQSEGAESYYKGIQIKSIKKMPKAYAAMFK
ncbi:MAG: DUF1080 domain-containing protein [Cyclobacteriaceae bacterium]